MASDFQILTTRLHDFLKLKFKKKTFGGVGGMGERAGRSMFFYGNKYKSSVCVRSSWLFDNECGIPTAKMETVDLSIKSHVT